MRTSGTSGHQTCLPLEVKVHFQHVEGDLKPIVPRDTRAPILLSRSPHEPADGHHQVMSTGQTVRDATVQDAEACAAIYAPYVTDTATTSELDPPSMAEMATRLASALDTHAWMVLEDQGHVVGYAYGSPYKARPAYRWSCEVSVYLELGRRRTGGGRALYDVLLTRLAERGFRTVVAGMTLPNDASVDLHAALGFEPVGVYRRIGWKHGRWHDVVWTQRALAANSGTPSEPR